MKGATMLATLQELGVMPSFSSRQLVMIIPFQRHYLKQQNTVQNIQLMDLTR
ncbi:MAG: hypothetical protein HOP07_17860 [Bacteriovoracaceae bacterium]|nr:hypothetical protein [Bacteriovoracaceae bacterium]